MTKLGWGVIDVPLMFHVLRLPERTPTPIYPYLSANFPEILLINVRANLCGVCSHCFSQVSLLLMFNNLQKYE